MKKFILILVLSLFLVNGKVLAETGTSSAETTTPTPTVQPKIQELKDRLATFAAQQKTVSTKAIYGTVKGTSISNFVVETDTKDIKIDLADDIKVAQMINGKRTKLTTDDISKGDIVTVFGDYDSSIDLLKAKAVFIQSASPLRVIGIVTGIDRAEYIETVAVDKDSYAVDIETDTKTTGWSPDKGIFKYGFSKAAVGDFVQVVAVPEPKQPPTRVSARRILDLGNLKNPLPTSTPTPTASPSATPKTTSKTTPTP